MNQGSILTVLGCSGSLVVALLVAQPAVAAPEAIAFNPASITASTEAMAPHSQFVQDDALIESLGCACSTCQRGTQGETSLGW
ncbi:MAG: hypothetical protein EA366_11260 [Spirulina sp. DLM2.Bin59]|nr:MAG: hypothetical protein EA366_11260 [Spirulina sp. DLM2.Bin59]